MGVVYAGATRTIAALANSEPGETATRFARVLLAVGLALSVAHYLPAFLIDVQNFYALLSDPLGRGWDLFGTIDYAIDNQVLTGTQIGVVHAASAEKPTIPEAMLKAYFQTERDNGHIPAADPSKLQFHVSRKSLLFHAYALHPQAEASEQEHIDDAIMRELDQHRGHFLQRTSDR